MPETVFVVLLQNSPEDEKHSIFYSKPITFIRGKRLQDLISLNKVTRSKFINEPYGISRKNLMCLGLLL